MKQTLIFLLFPFSFFGYSQQIDTTLIQQHGNTFYQLTREGNSKLLIFLHGGVSNTAFEDTSKVPSLNFLLEGNPLFLPLALKNGFDIVIPVTNDSLNWLNNYPYCYTSLSGFIEKYDSCYISGFSDGGTGSFKIFYSFPNSFMGLVVFNGYPQHKNFNKKVDYSAIENKPIAFFSTFKDDIIPYEFLLTEYCKQKASNANSFLYVKDGGHSFAEYGEKELSICFDILNSSIINTKKEALHGFVKNDSLIEFYPYRKKIVKKFAYGEETYKLNQLQEKQ